MSRPFDCEQPIHGPLGTVVGHCDRHPNHEGPCAVNSVTEADPMGGFPGSTPDVESCGPCYSRLNVNGTIHHCMLLNGHDSFHSDEHPTNPVHWSGAVSEGHE